MTKDLYSSKYSQFIERGIIMENIKKQSEEINDSELLEVNGGSQLPVTPGIRTMQFIPGKDDPTIMTTPATGAPLTVQPTPYTGGKITFSDTKKGGIESL